MVVSSTEMRGKRKDSLNVITIVVVSESWLPEYASTPAISLSYHADFCPPFIHFLNEYRIFSVLTSQ